MHTVTLSQTVKSKSQLREHEASYSTNRKNRPFCAYSLPATVLPSPVPSLIRPCSGASEYRKPSAPAAKLHSIETEQRHESNGEQNHKLNRMSGEQENGNGIMARANLGLIAELSGNLQQTDFQHDKESSHRRLLSNAKRDQQANPNIKQQETITGWHISALRRFCPQPASDHTISTNEPTTHTCE